MAHKKNWMPLSIHALLLFSMICFCLPSTVQAKDWTQWRGPNRDGRSSEKLKSTNWKRNPPKHVWTMGGFGEGYAGVAVFNGHIYTTGNVSGGQAVVAANADSGEVIWKTVITPKTPKHGYVGARCTPSVDNDRIYAIASSGAIVCLNTKDGRLLWKKDFAKEWGGKMMSGWGFSESPLVDGDYVLCTPGGKNAMIVCLNKLTGETVWQTKVPKSREGDKGKDGAGYSSIIISNGVGVKQYVQLTGRGLMGVRASDGRFLWKYTKVANKTANIPTPIAQGDYVFASSGYGTGSGLVKLRKSGNKVVAKEVYFLTGKTFQNHHGGMIFKDGFVYAGHQHNKGFPICVHMQSGKIRWGGKLRGPGKGSASVVMVDDHLIFRYQDGTVALIEATPKGYQLKGSFQPDYQKGKTWAHPVVADGKLYLREQDKLMCYDLGS